MVTDQVSLQQIALTLREKLIFMQQSGIVRLPRKKSEGLGERMVSMQSAEEKCSKGQRLEELKNDQIGNCTRCKLHNNRSNIVFGTGNPNAELVFIGEAPGADEDASGEPFVGRAGKLLTKMIEAMGYTREDVYICNVIKCRPPENRNPEPEEVESCEPFLKSQLSVIRPKVIVTLGRFASQCILKTDTQMSDIRGKWNEYEGIAVMPTFHPAYLLYNASKKKEVWEDLQAVMKKLGKPLLEH